MNILNFHISCTPEFEITFSADPANAEERRFLRKLARGDVEIKRCTDVVTSPNGPDEAMGCKVIIGYKV